MKETSVNFFGVCVNPSKVRRAFELICWSPAVVIAVIGLYLSVMVIGAVRVIEVLIPLVVSYIGIRLSWDVISCGISCGRRNDEFLLRSEEFFLDMFLIFNFSCFFMSMGEELGFILLDSLVVFFLIKMMFFIRLVCEEGLEQACKLSIFGVIRGPVFWYVVIFCVMVCAIICFIIWCRLMFLIFCYRVSCVIGDILGNFNFGKNNLKGLVSLVPICIGSKTTTELLILDVGSRTSRVFKRYFGAKLYKLQFFSTTPWGDNILLGHMPQGNWGKGTRISPKLLGIWGLTTRLYVPADCWYCLLNPNNDTNTIVDNYYHVYTKRTYRPNKLYPPFGFRSNDDFATFVIGLYQNKNDGIYSYQEFGDLSEGLKEVLLNLGTYGIGGMLINNVFGEDTAMDLSMAIMRQYFPVLWCCELIFDPYGLNAPSVECSFGGLVREVPKPGYNQQDVGMFLNLNFHNLDQWIDPEKIHDPRRVSIDGNIFMKMAPFRTTVNEIAPGWYEIKGYERAPGWCEVTGQLTFRWRSSYGLEICQKLPGLPEETMYPVHEQHFHKIIWGARATKYSSGLVFSPFCAVEHPLYLKGNYIGTFSYGMYYTHEKGVGFTIQLSIF